MSKAEQALYRRLDRIAEALEKHNDIQETLTNLLALNLQVAGVDFGVETDEPKNKPAQESNLSHLPSMYQKNFEKQEKTS